MKKLVSLFAVCLLCINVHAVEREIQYSHLPKKARAFVETYFPGSEIKKVVKERRASLIQYEVKVKGGYKLQFTRSGSITEIECKDKPIPDKVLPSQIRKSVAANFPNNKVMGLEHDSSLFEILLDNGYQLIFSRDYRLIDIDEND